MMTEEMRCAKHPNQVTNLTCSRCSKPVCARCMVYSPVGIQCPECARQRRSGAFAPSAGHLVQAGVAGLATAAALGILWGLFPVYGFWIALVLGFGGGELVSLGANRRRGPELQVIAAVMVIGAFLVAFALSSARSAPMDGHLFFATAMAGLAMVLATVRQR